MAYTRQDLENVQDAIVRLATGKRVAKIAVAGKVIEFAQADVKALQDLQAEIQAALDSAAGKKGVVLTRTSKGL